MKKKVKPTIEEIQESAEYMAEYVKLMPMNKVELRNYFHSETRRRTGEAGRINSGSHISVPKIRALIMGGWISEQLGVPASSITLPPLPNLPPRMWKGTHIVAKQCCKCQKDYSSPPKSLNPYCPACYNAYRKQRRLDGKDVPSFREARERNLRQNYGISLAQYEEMLKQQGGLCAACRQPEDFIQRGRIAYLGVDHCHKTGVIRGLLCHSCNSALGYLRDDPTLLSLLLDYIQRFDRGQIAFKSD